MLLALELKQSDFQSEPETVLLVANPTWASKIWPYVNAKSGRFQWHNGSSYKC